MYEYTLCRDTVAHCSCWVRDLCDLSLLADLTTLALEATPYMRQS